MKPKHYIDKIRILAKSDLRCGNEHKIKALIPKLIKEENYEALQGIKQAANETGSKIFN